MEQPLQITYRNVQRSEALELMITNRFESLVNQHPNITHCRVIVEKIHQHHKLPRNYHVRLSAAVNGNTLVVGNPNSRAHTGTNPYIAASSAFDALEKQVDRSKAKYRSFLRIAERRKAIFQRWFQPALSSETAALTQ